MTDQSLRRADELIATLVEQVETARALPMSSSCVVPRERVLDLLDELSEALPAELGEARRVIAGRDTLLHEAYTEATGVRERAGQHAETMTANAAAQAAELIRDAEDRAQDTLERANAEYAEMVAASTVHQHAVRAAARLRRQADDYAREVHERSDSYGKDTIAEADGHAAEVRAAADRYAAKLSADSEEYADRTLHQLAATLHRAAATAEQGRRALSSRRSGHLRSGEAPGTSSLDVGDGQSDCRDEPPADPRLGAASGRETDADRSAPDRHESDSVRA